MHGQSTTAAREGEVDEAANLVDTLFGLVRQRRQLSYEERIELRQQVSDRVRELVVGPVTFPDGSSFTASGTVTGFVTPANG
jgi:hypothetical protein